MWTRVVASTALVVGVLAAAPTPSYAVPSAAASTSAPAPRCSAGLVALTFDDGPSTSMTPTLLRILRQRKVRATFFMVGQRVGSARGTVRAVARDGHVIANHSWAHTLMTSQTDAQVRASLRSTDRALRRAGVRPSNLMRPPYGGVNARVRAAIASAGFVPVLWTVDTRDWAGRSTGAIADAVISGLRRRATNIVLQHDGVGNSPRSVAAVPAIVRRARRLGYCFATLGRDGRPTPPVPHATMTTTNPREGKPARVRVTLSEPTSRPTSVRLSTHTGRAGRTDFVARRVRVHFPVGATSRTVRIRTRQDALDEPDERFRVRLGAPRGMTARKQPRRVRILDDDPPPRLGVTDLTVDEPTGAPVTTRVRVTLDRPSGRTVKVTLRARRGTAGPADFTATRATLRFRPGATTATFPVTITPDSLDEPAETFTVEVTAVGHARVRRGKATVTINPPPTPPAVTEPGPGPTRQRPARR